VAARSAAAMKMRGLNEAAKATLPGWLSTLAEMTNRLSPRVRVSPIPASSAVSRLGSTNTRPPS
jgi:hypothetical protein